MNKIHKGPEPKELTEHRTQLEATYNNLPTEAKEAVKTALLTEQGYLCAYCMQRIDAEYNGMKVEHWHCQDNYKDEQLHYKNLLGCCRGNEGNPPGDQHCDTKKGNNNLSFNPANSEHHPHLKIRYTAAGKVYSQDKTFNKEINNTLNLNFSRLISNRKSVWIAVTDVLRRKPGTRTQSEMTQFLRKWTTKDSQGRFKEYNGVAIYYLNKKLKSLTK